MSKIAVVYHSGYGHTKQQAEAVVEGAKMVSGSEVTLYAVDEALVKMEELHAADAIIFGAPTYMGSMSGPLKSFFDETGKFWTKQIWKDKLAAGFTSSSNPSGDKVNTINGIFLLAMQHGMIWVGEGILPGMKSADFGDVELNHLGVWNGAGVQSVKGGPGLQDGGVETSKYLGKRVAEATARWVKGRA
jgi:NAD(P)H dehydrogenase (quinone)